MKAVWKNKLALLIFGADMLSNFGDTLYYMALMNYILILPDPKLALSAVTLSEIIPMIFSFPIGIQADKTSQKQPRIIATLLLRFALYLIVGLVMGFTPALWIVLLATGINCLSDLAGLYENALYSPLFLRLVGEDDRQAMMGFRQSAGAVLKIVFQASGAILISIMSYRHLAVLNAMTFGLAALLIFLISPKINQLLKANPIKVVESQKGQSGFIRELGQVTKELYEEVKKQPVMVASFVVVPALNAMLGIMDAMLVLVASHNPQFLIRDLPTTLTLLVTTVMVGNILGGVLAMSLAKDWKIIPLLKVTTTFPVLLYLAFYLENIYLILVSMLVICLSAGIINPKFWALFMSTMPEERLGSFGAGLNTYFTLGIVLVKLVMSGLILVLTSGQISLIFMVLSLFLLIWTMIKVKPVKE